MGSNTRSGTPRPSGGESVWASGPLVPEAVGVCSAEPRGDLAVGVERAGQRASVDAQGPRCSGEVDDKNGEAGESALNSEYTFIDPRGRHHEATNPHHEHHWLSHITAALGRLGVSGGYPVRR